MGLMRLALRPALWFHIGLYATGFFPQRNLNMKTNEIIIEPHTVVDGQMKHTDIAATAIYNTTVSIINSERTVVWQRYQALLLANSIVFGFMGRGDLSTAYVLIAGVLGLMLCLCWWHLTNDGQDGKG
jgi:hypothetical protein